MKNEPLLAEYGEIGEYVPLCESRAERFDMRCVVDFFIRTKGDLKEIRTIVGDALGAQLGRLDEKIDSTMERHLANVCEGIADGQTETKRTSVICEPTLDPT